MGRKYQKITKNPKIRRQIIYLRKQGNTNKEISIIISAQTGTRITEKTIQSIKTIKRKSKYLTYRQQAIALTIDYIQEFHHNLLNISNENKQRRRVSLLLKKKFPQPFPLFSQRTHQRCINRIVSKINLILNNQESQQTNNNQDSINYFLQTQSQVQSIQSPSIFINDEDQMNSIQERMTDDLNFY
ncbi:unnamed protein product [Paramecium pentaurelia]|uniref:Uncharacterized protein n=1 Tax=Paramecium pentaurelia TaxID=43138 RepID=A0A8S1TQX9_9CILI|nr:unnamed protein product [Paramecium pentaurelia]